MRNKELERIAALIAVDGELKTDGECLGDVWAYLEECGINPDDFRSCSCPDPEDTTSLCPLCTVKADVRLLEEALEEQEEETRVISHAQAFLVGTILRCRSLADYDCVFEFEVVRRTPSFVTLRYFGNELRVAIRTDRDGREYCFPLGKHSMAPMLYAEPF